MRRLLGWAILAMVFCVLFLATALARGWVVAALAWGGSLLVTGLALLAVRLITH